MKNAGFSLLQALVILDLIRCFSSNYVLIRNWELLNLMYIRVEISPITKLKRLQVDNKLYVHYGCGRFAPSEWKNFDVSPTLRIQKTPIIGVLLKSRLNVIFPKNVLVGNIIKGLPVEDNSCDGVYCSHTLEHLSLNDFRTSLKNTYKMMKEGAIFRCVVPDLESAARTYVNELDGGNREASLQFVHDNTLLGTTERPRGLKGIMTSVFGNANHLWMWDHDSLSYELEQVGFKQIRRCKFNDCDDEMFTLVEDASRFEGCVAIECRK